MLKVILSSFFSDIYFWCFSQQEKLLFVPYGAFGCSTSCGHWRKMSPPCQKYEPPLFGFWSDTKTSLSVTEVTMHSSLTTAIRGRLASLSQCKSQQETNVLFSAIAVCWLQQRAASVYQDFNKFSISNVDAVLASEGRPTDQWEVTNRIPK